MDERHLIFLVEEPSMEVFLGVFLDSVLPEYCSYETHTYQGKQDLLAKLPSRLRGYAQWLPTNWSIFVLIDRDDDSCLRLKNALEQAAFGSGLITRTRGSYGTWQLANRVVVEELEAWYIGDPEAICMAYPRIIRKALGKARYRDPDAVAGGTWETFERLLQRRSYFKNGLRKVEAARAMAAQMVPERNCSHSFQVFYSALMEAISLTK